ncbi:Peptidase M20D, amidohydrolase, predicted [Penicillium expansum]|nr:Peptidase M20D, amidohydrolase, predicted [Penicillium expansum]
MTAITFPHSHGDRDAVSDSQDVEDIQNILRIIDSKSQQLWEINQKIHSNPELGYKEFMAHDNITSMLETLGFKVTRHAYGLDTSFVAEYGHGGRVVAFNAEYDALPGIGHACGHNLIAMMSIGAFLGVAGALEQQNIPGRVRLVGTPAEEGLGGKIPIINAGAYKDVDACMMVHPGPFSECPGFTGDAYMPTLASLKVTIRFTGKTAHAAMAPWEGTNALDAAVLSYSGIGVLRQQMHPCNRVHCVISDGGLRPNIIPGSSALDCYIRSPTVAMAEELFPLATAYAQAMSQIGTEVRCDLNSSGVPGSTDQGNVTYECPGIQAYVGIPAGPGANNHTPGFTAVAGSKESHELCMHAAKGMAITGLSILKNDKFAEKVKSDFEEDKIRRSLGSEPRMLAQNAGFC